MSEGVAITAGGAVAGRAGSGRFAALARYRDRGRTGCKGPRAAECLRAAGLALPAEPNTYEPQASSDALVARLGSSEFFIEHARDAPFAASLTLALAGRPPGVYAVPREDWGFRLEGEGVHDILAQVCNVDFGSLAIQRRPVIMTLLAGVAVLVVPMAEAAGRVYSVWCDPTFGPYLSATLGAVVVESGGIFTGEKE